MELRYEGKTPVGLDWTVWNENSDPSAWKEANLQPNEPKVRRELKRAAIKQPGIGRGGAQRLASEIERQVIVLYRDEKKSALEIAAIFNIRSATVFKVLRRNGVSTRSRSDAMRISRARTSQE